MQALYYDIVDSTNDEARRLLAEHRAPVGDFYLTARKQRAGRGTCGRNWSSPREAGLYMTIVLRGAFKSLPTTDRYTLAIGHALADHLRQFTCLPVEVKPINDLMIDSRKVGGILTEAMIVDGVISDLIIGIGLNTHRADRGLPPEQVTALQEHLSREHFAQLEFPRLVEEWAVVVAQCCRSIYAPSVGSAMQEL
ncbi:MAG: Bifunctional ligase/repressor BirA [Phycisphaerae bacterium]|nr:Bifunctional ligase/repressor BirA [Phycisphaerae bacterium]